MKLNPYRKWILVWFLMLIGCGFPLFSIHAGQEADVKQKIEKLIDKKDFRHAIRLLKKSQEQIGMQSYYYYSKMAYLNAKTGDRVTPLKFWTQGHKRGYFFGLALGFSTYQDFESVGGFKELKERDKQLWQAAVQKNRCRARVLLPTNYQQKRTYPLLMVFHGGGSSTDQAMKHWRSRRLKREFVTVFVQSYLHYDYETFGWKGFDPRARKEIQEIYKDSLRRYRIDTRRILVGGISAGSVMAIDLAVNRVIPVTGFIGVCALTPKQFEDSAVDAAAKGGLRGVFIGGDKDFGFKRQQQMEKAFRKHRMLFRFMFRKGLGHRYPEDFSNQLDDALAFLDCSEIRARDFMTVEKNIKNTIGWAKDKDLNTLYSIIADDPNYLEIHPGNRVVKGISEFRKAEKFWMDDRFKHVGFDVSDLKINFSTAGDVAWFYCKLNDYNSWENKEVNWENTRWTGVLEREKGSWWMKQMHFSYPEKKIN